MKVECPPSKNESSTSNESNSMNSADLNAAANNDADARSISWLDFSIPKSTSTNQFKSKLGTHLININKQISPGN